MNRLILLRGSPTRGWEAARHYLVGSMLSTKLSRFKTLMYTLVILGPVVASEETASSSRINAATLTYGERSSARCFSEAFLGLIRKETSVDAPTRLTPIALSDTALAAYPFALLSGEGYFRFTDADRKNLRRYLLNGGFLLASAGCSSAAWDASFREQMRDLLPEFTLTPLPEEHRLLSFLFDCRPLKLKDGAAARLEAIIVDGRIACVYSPAGLNDTASLPDCCCCTGNEIAASASLNANIFLYALFQVAE